MATSKVKKVIDIIEWIIIIGLTVLCIIIYNNKKNTSSEVIVSDKEDTYVKIYNSQKLEALQNENEELYAEIQQLKDANNAVQIQYKYKYITDTIYVPITETIMDSVYYYTDNNDTIKYDLYINASNIKWHKTNFELNDKFTIISSELSENINSLVVKHSENVDIVNVDAWKKKTKFKDHIFYGPSIGVGYGFFNKKLDVYIGFTAGYQF